jgi:acetyl esterase/lipase
MASDLSTAGTRRDAGSAHGMARRLRRSIAPALATAFALALAAAPSALGAVKPAISSLGVYEYLRYGPSPLEVANVYPSATPNSPLVVLVHGGGWRKQGPLGRLELEAGSLRAQGFTVVEVNYDQDSLLTPAFPLEPNDIEAATRWAIAHAADFNANPADVVLLGGSAGGHLVALAAEELDAAAPGTVEQVVTLSAPTNFLSLIGQLEEDSLSNEMFDTSVHRALGYTDPAPMPWSYAARWSPALNVPSGGCPSWLIFNSEAEFIPLAQAQELNAALNAAHCSSRLEVVPGSEHGFTYFHRVKPVIFSFIKSQ